MYTHGHYKQRYKHDGTGVYGAGHPKKLIISHTDNCVINYIIEFS